MCQKRKKGRYKVTYRTQEVYIGIYECASKMFLTKKSALKWIEKNKITNYKIEKIKRSIADEIYMR